MRRVRAARARAAVRTGFVHLAGPARVDLADDQVAVVSLMKDAVYFVRGFIEHHQALGVAHIVIVDNGSTDGTVEIARGYSGVTVVQNSLPAKVHECLLRVEGGRRVVRGGWLCFVDSDELLEMPFAAGRLSGLLRYLNAQGFTAMVTQMLDLFSTRPYGETKALDYAGAIAAFDRMSLRQITAVPYHDQEAVEFNWFLRGNVCESETVRLQLGGVRREVFGEACFLSKHSLVRNVAGVEPMVHPHCASGVRVADVTGVLRHYKLAGAFLDRDRRSVAAGTWDHAEDAKRLAAAKAGDGFVVQPAQSLAYAGPEDLVARGFLAASEQYRVFMAEQEKG